MIPGARAGGRPRKATSRELVNAVLYFLRAAWIFKNRRLVRDYEQLTDVAETLITIAASATLLRRWTGPNGLLTRALRKIQSEAGLRTPLGQMHPVRLGCLAGLLKGEGFLMEAETDVKRHRN
ncbi:hypothetical protein [Sphingomonas sp.]|uniref:hypothetical protein n=1 Tax=Sphingomonas sp. TaxID=28214 RepID=UPI003AFFC0FE